MRILHVTDFYLPVRGGLEVYVDDLAAELAERGHDVHIATLTADARPSDVRVTPHQIETLSAKVVRHEMAQRPFAPPAPDPRARSQLRALLRRLQPDVVHAHTLLGLSLPSRRPPLVWTAHEYAIACQLRTLWRDDRSVCDGPALGKCIRCGSATYGRGKSVVLTLGTTLSRHVFLRPDAALALSQQVRRALTPHIGFEIEVIPGFVRRPVEASEAPALADSRFVLFAGDPRHHKGIDVLLQAWPQVRSASQLVLATSRPLDQVLPPGVSTVALRPEQMSEAWARAALAVIPSLWAEPFGLVAIEALAAGTPVVAAASGALPELVTDGVDGCLVPPGDPTALAVAIDRLLEDEGRRKAMSDAARTNAERFAAHVVIPRIESVYERVVGARHRS